VGNLAQTQEAYVAKPRKPTTLEKQKQGSKARSRQNQNGGVGGKNRHSKRFTP